MSAFSSHQASSPSTSSGDSTSNGAEPVATPPVSTAAPALPLPGPYPVGCSNVAQDLTRLPAGENAADYWNGRPSASGAPRRNTPTTTGRWSGSSSASVWRAIRAITASRSVVV